MLTLRILRKASIALVSSDWSWANSCASRWADLC